ncbi:hypothetical protein, partial [Adonisia turfae]|uniref:hypothetical protein n=1 Tax=Adonisia turfae TaxID=2950184 RepID=UPI002029AC6B
KITLKKIKLEGSWSGSNQIDIRFIGTPIGAPVTISQTSQWVQYPPNTTLELPGFGNLWAFVNGSYFSMSASPLNSDPTQINVEAVIRLGNRDIHVRYDIVP